MSATTEIIVTATTGTTNTNHTYDHVTFTPHNTVFEFTPNPSSATVWESDEEEEESEPHTCPVCAGRGIVAKGFYTGCEGAKDPQMIRGRETVECRACEDGVVWDS